MIFVNFVVVIDIATYQGLAISLIYSAHELMCMPRKVNVESGDEERFG